MHSPTVYMAGIGRVSLHRVTTILAELRARYAPALSQKENRERLWNAHPDFI